METPTKNTNRASYPDDAKVVVKVRFTRTEYDAFSAVCASDGMSVPGALSFLARWATRQNSLCPVGEPKPLDEDLKHELRRLCRRLGIIDADDAGEEWKQ